MIYRINYEGKRKFALPVKNRKELMALRNSQENLDNLAKARQGDSEAKGRLLQLAYNIGYVNGQIAGCKSIGSYFFHDVDCYDNEHSERIKSLILEKKDEIGLRMLERSASGGWHLVCERRRGTTILENQVRVATILKVEMDTSAKDLQRVVFSTSGSEEDLPYLDDCLFEEPMSAEECEAEYGRLKVRVMNKKEDLPAGAKKANKHYRPWEEEGSPFPTSPRGGEEAQASSINLHPSVQQIVMPNKRTRFIAEGVMKEKELVSSDFLSEGGRHNTVKIFLSGITQLLTKEETNGVLRELMPEHWSDENIQKLVDDFYQNYTDPSQRLLKYQEQLFTKSQRIEDEDENGNEDENEQLSIFNSQLSTNRMPQGVRESIDAIGPQLVMPAIIAICPAIGALATGVTLDVHGQKKGLNLIAYIAGDFASGKGNIDPVVDAWMSEVQALDDMYTEQENEWRKKKKASVNKKEQPEEPMLPIRNLTLNNTVANLAQQLANTEGKHAFSFTPEADTVAQKWKSSVCDFSVMLRQSYDGTKYERRAKSVDAVNVNIKHLLWNVVMCGTPDALYRVVNNYTDGFQSRIAIARTPDNTYAKLEDNPHVLTDRQTERIQQIAHLLPFMYGEVVLPKLEARGREWLERIRLETMMNDDKVRARQRFRVCVTAQRMTCCLMLCKVCETLIQKHGLNGAESRLKQFPNLWKEMLLKAQTPTMLEIYDVIADSLLENALYFFRERIEKALRSRDYAGNNERRRIGKNDSIFTRLDTEFSFEQAMQHSVAIKGADVSRNQVHQMLKNWKNQGLIIQDETGRYRKLS